MIDIHTHVLPNIDDGAASKSETDALAKMLAAQGVKKIILTPHYYLEKQSIEEFLTRRETAFEMTKAVFLENNITVKLGAEVYFSPQLMKSRGIEKLAISGTRFILLELPFSKKWNKIAQNLKAFMDETDLIPIIAHIEQYPSSSVKYAAEFSQLGCALQIDAESICDSNSRKSAFTYFDKGLANVIASDAHNTTTRPPLLEKAYEIIQDNYGESVTNALKKTAEYIFCGK